MATSSSETGKRPLESHDHDTGKWVSIGAACEYLGVNRSTLRRWTDEGRIPVFTTPGGHRRFAESDLESLVKGELRPNRSRVDRRELTSRSLSAYEEDYLQEARTRRWYRNFDGETQQKHRLMGRRLVGLAMRYAVLSQDNKERTRLLDEGRDIGKFYGISGAEAGLGAGETIEAFLYFRYPTVRAVLGIIEEEQLPARRASRLFIAIDDFIDQVLLSMMRAYDPARSHAGHIRGQT